MPGPPLRTLDVDHQSAAGITVEGVPVSWGVNTPSGSLGHDILDGSDADGAGNQIPAPIQHLP